MKKITIELILTEDFSSEQIVGFKEIFQVLLDKGALTGIKGGSANLHFDGEGVFQGVQLDYWPWRRRKKY